MARILITGGAGFIGSHLCESFLKRGDQVVCVDNVSTGSRENIAAFSSNSRFAMVDQDVTRFIQVDGPLDMVLHFASPASPVDYMEMPIQTLKVGSLGTHNALGLAKAKEAIVVPPMPVKPAYAKPGAQKASKEQVAERRVFILGMSFLAIGFTALGATAAAWTLGTVRFMFPNILREPPSRFSVGSADKFPPGQVEERFKAQFGVWIVNTEYNGQQEIFALKSVCTHLGCTPNWLEAEQKFKCPCHGSGFYKDGINFEGPAPRPLERYAIGIGSDGSIEVDKSRTFQEEMGAWNDPSSFIPV